ncbi:hypothetical protein ACIQ4I_07590 [Rummeliibacillus sp. NPDC094406]|uniref:hypothetical protein n=1 Tax=Rummeliibacillus sp. NPDC094406 TaxID=3364511 RepID=UPI003807F74E
MRSKSLVSMGLASALIVPTLITSANPQMVHAKSASKVNGAAQPEVKKVSNKISKKAKAVIKKIKAINPKKSNYIAKTKSAKNAYNKLSKKDKKMVTNYSTLKKHWNKIQPSLKKIDQLNKSVSTLNTKNITTKATSVQKQYNSLNATTKAAVPTATVKKLNYYADVSSTHKLMLMSVDTDSMDGSVILNIINSYKKLSAGQQTLLRDLLDDSKYNEEPRLDRYLALEDVVKIAADIEKKYAALKPASSSKYAQDLVALYKEYAATANEPKKYMPHNNVIANIGNVYKKQIEDASKFSDEVDKLEAGSISTDNILSTINNLSQYKEKGITDPTSSYPKVAPIDLADKKDVATYNKYAPIPAIVDGFNSFPVLNTVTPGSLSSSTVSKMADLLAQYKKLGANQKTIVQNLIPTKSDYLSEDKNIANAQAIDKSYDMALKNKSKPSYYNDLLKASNAYDNAPDEVKRFVGKVDAIKGSTTSKDYLEAINNVKKFTEKVNAIPNASIPENAENAIAEAVSAYNTVASNPAWLALVDKNTLKTYLDYAKVPDVLKSVAKILAATSYKANDITNMLSTIKDYKKLGGPQKQIVDAKYPSFSNIVADEANIKEAQKIDSSYLKLKKSSKTYPSDAKKVFTSYDDASDDVKKYVVNGDKIAKLLNTFTPVQERVTDFEELVKPLSKKSTIKNVEDAVDYYNKYISPDPKASSLVDKAIMKKYNQYAPISDVVKMFSLIKESTVNSPTITPTDAKYIQKVIKAYNALGPDQQMIVDNEDRSKFPFLEDAEEITAAEVIDKAFEKIKPTDDKYEIEVLDVYYKLYDRALPIVKKYVANKATLEEIGQRYKPQLDRAREFETMVTDMSHVSQKGNTPGVLDVRKLEKYYEDYIKYNIINAKYNVPLKTLIDPDILATYEKYLPILQIQDIAKSLYVQYGKLFNYENNKKTPIGYTDTGKADGTPIKITNPNDINSIYKAIELYKKLESPQRAILDKAPKFLGDHEYEDKYHIPYTGDHVESEVIRPSIPLSDDEIKNFLKAQEIDKAFEALNPSSESYPLDAVKLYYQFNKAGKNVQIYVMHEKEIEDFKTNYNTAKVIAGLDDFVKAVNALSNDSSYAAVKDVVDKYNKLNEAQLALLDKPTLTKYNSYAPIVELKTLAGKVNNPVNGKYKEPDITTMLQAIAIYKKLGKDPKAIVIREVVPDYAFLNHEKEIKDAQKIDKTYKALDKSDDKYVANLKKVIKDYDKLSAIAKKYVVSDIDAARDFLVNKTPNQKAEDFEKSVMDLLDKYPMTYKDVKAVVDEYEGLSSKAKSLVDSNILKTYNKYAPIVTIVKTLQNIDPSSNPSNEKAGYYKNKYPKRDVASELSDAIKLYGKLGLDQKDVINDTTIPDYLNAGQLALLKESANIKAAQDLDKKTTSIKKGSSGYVKAVIDANKTLKVMPGEQKVYLQNADTLKGYATSKQMIQAIDDLANFEKGVDSVEELSSDAQVNKDSIISTLIDLVKLYDKLNTTRLIDGSETKLSTLIDRNKFARYQYYLAVYDIMDLIKKN